VIVNLEDEINVAQGEPQDEIMDRSNPVVLVDKSTK
jgi:hypothetical protein